MILSHVKELLEQAVDKIHAVYQECDIGIYSTGLKRWDTDNKCIVARNSVRIPKYGWFWKI